MLNEHPAVEPSVRAETTIFDREVQESSATAPVEIEAPDDPCVFIYTSGTTGFPKGVMHSQRNVVLAGEGFVQRMYLQPDDRLMCILPTFHINALFYSLSGAIAAGAALVLIARFSASRFWHDVAHHHATEVNTMAAVSTVLMRRPRSEFVTGHALRRCAFPQQTEAAFRDGWFLTGDLAWCDTDGYFWFVARKKDIIRRRGENVSGAELDRIVELHPDVVQAAAIPVPNDLGEDEILVAATLKPGATLTERGLADWVRQRLAASKVPRYVIFVPALPQTPTHRVAKFKLRADASQQHRAVDIVANASP